MLGAVFSTVLMDSYDETSFKWNMFIISMLCASIILTSLRFIPFSLHRKYSELSLILEHSVLDEKNNTYSITWKHFQNCSKSFNAIQRNRRIIITLFCILGGCYVVLSFVVNSFPLLVALVSLSFGAVLMIDSILYDHIAYKNMICILWMNLLNAFLHPRTGQPACAHGITTPKWIPSDIPCITD